MAELTIVPDNQTIAILKNTTGLMRYPGGLPTKPGARAIRAGDPLAKNDADQVVVAKRSTAPAIEPIGETEIAVVDAHPFEVNDSVSISGETFLIEAVNYVTNVITLPGAGLVGASAANDEVNVITEEMDDVLGIALSDVVDSNARLTNLTDKKTPIHTVVYGDIAIAGMFKLSAIKNLLLGGQVDTDLGGVDQADSDVYIITSPPAGFTLE